MGWRTTALGTGFLAVLLVAGASVAGRSEPAVVSEARADPPAAMMTSLMRLAVASDDNIGDVMHNDALLSGGFSVVNRRAIPKALKGEVAVDKRAWIDLGVQTLIKHRVVGKTIRFEHYDFARRSKPLTVRDYPAADWRSSAHRFMNDVVKFYTGSGGDFGSRIAFVQTHRASGVSKNVFTMDMDGARVSTTTSNRSLNVLPSLGPGGEVLFTSYGKRNPDLWIEAGKRPIRVSSRPGLNLGGVMSPDGRRIALALSKDGNSELYALDSSGAVETRLTEDPAIDGSPTWSPTGDRIAFVSDRDGSPQVYVASATGADVTRMTKEGDYNVSPDWNPTIPRIVAYTSRSESRLRVRVFDLDTHRSRVLVRGGEHETDPSWSPTGFMVAFATPRGVKITAEADLFAPTLVMPGASQPDWGPAAP